MSNSQRILFSHPHPDDESIACGGSIAHYVASGAQVTLVNATLGEEGEIHVPELAGLAAAEGDQLGGYRLAELHNAARALGVVDHRILGGAGRYRDSGMMDTPANDHPRAFWRADVAEAASYLAKIIDEVRPHVVVSDDENGSYGHPDHIQTNRVTQAAIQQASWRVPKVYYTAIPRSAMERGIAQFKNSENNPFSNMESIDDVPFLIPDSGVTARIDISAQVTAKLAALRAHASQIPQDSWLFEWATNFGGESVEYYTLVSGDRGPGFGEHNWENDLFAGLDLR